MKQDPIKIEVRRSVDATLAEAKFNSKMTHEQRCFALCLHIEGYSWRIIAAYYGTHYRTIQMIKMGPRYRSVRQDYNNLGQDAFVAKYNTEVAMDEFKKWASENSDVLEAVYQNEDASKPNFRAVRSAKLKEGQHKKTSVVDGSEVQFNVDWRDAESGVKPGWYVLIHGSWDGPYGTSSMAYDSTLRHWNPTSKPLDAAIAEPALGQLSELEQIVSNGIKARSELVINTNADTIAAFAEASLAAVRYDAKLANMEFDIEAAIQQIDWRDIDPEPFGVQINGIALKRYD